MSLLPSIKDEDDIIDLDEYDESWEDQIKKLLLRCICGKTLLDDLLVFYGRSLRKQIRVSKEKSPSNDKSVLQEKTLLRDKILEHLSFFKEQYENLNDFMSSSDYYELMEDILAYYCMLEIELFRRFYSLNVKKHRKECFSYARERAQKICTLLVIYLTRKESHIMHTLLKMKYNCKSEACRLLLRYVYLYILTLIPVVEKSDEIFCRRYLIFLSFKEMVPDKDHTKMEKTLFDHFDKTEESIGESEMLRSILMVNPTCAIDALNLIVDLRNNLISLYFKYMNSAKQWNNKLLISDAHIPLSSQELSQDQLAEKVFGSIHPNQFLVDAKIEDSDDVKIEDTADQPVFTISSEDSDCAITYYQIPRRRKKKKKKQLDPNELINLDSDEEIKINENTTSETIKQTDQITNQNSSIDHNFDTNETFLVKDKNTFSETLNLNSSERLDIVENTAKSEHGTDSVNIDKADPKEIDAVEKLNIDPETHDQNSNVRLCDTEHTSKSKQGTDSVNTDKPGLKDIDAVEKLNINLPSGNKEIRNKKKNFTTMSQEDEFLRELDEIDGKDEVNFEKSDTSKCASKLTTFKSDGNTSKEEENEKVNSNYSTPPEKASIPENPDASKFPDSSKAEIEECLKNKPKNDLPVENESNKSVFSNPVEAPKKHSKEFDQIQEKLEELKVRENKTEAKNQNLMKLEKSDNQKFQCDSWEHSKVPAECSQEVKMQGKEENLPNHRVLREPFVAEEIKVPNQTVEFQNFDLIASENPGKIQKPAQAHSVDKPIDANKVTEIFSSNESTFDPDSKISTAKTTDEKMKSSEIKSNDVVMGASSSNTFPVEKVKENKKEVQLKKEITLKTSEENLKGQSKLYLEKIPEKTENLTNILENEKMKSKLTFTTTVIKEGTQKSKFKVEEFLAKSSAKESITKESTEKHKRRKSGSEKIDEIFEEYKKSPNTKRKSDSERTRNLIKPNTEAIDETKLLSRKEEVQSLQNIRQKFGNDLKHSKLKPEIVTPKKETKSQSGHSSKHEGNLKTSGGAQNLKELETKQLNSERTEQLLRKLKKAIVKIEITDLSSYEKKLEKELDSDKHSTVIKLPKQRRKSQDISKQKFLRPERKNAQVIVEGEANKFDSSNLSSENNDGYESKGKKRKRLTVNQEFNQNLSRNEKRMRGIDTPKLSSQKQNETPEHTKSFNKVFSPVTKKLSTYEIPTSTSSLGYMEKMYEVAGQSNDIFDSSCTEFDKIKGNKLIGSPKGKVTDVSALLQDNLQMSLQASPTQKQNGELADSLIYKYNLPLTPEQHSDMECEERNPSNPEIELEKILLTPSDAGESNAYTNQESEKDQDFEELEIMRKHNRIHHSFDIPNDEEDLTDHSDRENLESPFVVQNTLDNIKIVSVEGNLSAVNDFMLDDNIDHNGAKHIWEQSHVNQLEDTSLTSMQRKNDSLKLSPVPRPGILKNSTTIVHKQEKQTSTLKKSHEKEGKSIRFAKDTSYKGSSQEEYMKKHNSKRSCITQRIETKIPMASPSNVPDPVKFLRDHPITGTVDYSKILCDASPFSNEEEKEEVNSNYIACPEKALNLIIPEKPEDPGLQIEFSNSPKFLTDPQQLEQCLVEEDVVTDHSINNLLSKKDSSNSFLSNHSNFYSNKVTNLVTFYNHINELKDDDIEVPSITPEMEFDASDIVDNVANYETVISDSDVLKELNKINYDEETEMNLLLDSLKSDNEMRLPFKKRRMSVSLKEDVVKEEISYPATPMISIAEVEALQERRSFKTPAELKEMPPLPNVYQTPIEQFNLNTFTPPETSFLPCMPCPSYYPVNPIILPFNNVPNFENITKQQVYQSKSKREGRTKRGRSNENYYVYNLMRLPNMKQKRGRPKKNDETMSKILITNKRKKK